MKFILLFLVLTCESYFAVGQIISTIAGHGVIGFGGDGNLATLADFNAVDSVILDAIGNIYLCDVPRVRRVDRSTGIIATVAGNQTSGFSGDGGLAVNAMLTIPKDLSFDAFGNFFISDALNHRIRFVNITTGIITTFAGTGVKGFSGDGGDAKLAALDTPFGLARDTQGKLYVSVTGSRRIRVINTATGIITTFAGTGGNGFSGDGGPATSASFLSPGVIVFDPQGNLIVTDRGNFRIRKIAVTTTIVSTIAGTGNSGFSGDGGLATAADIGIVEGLAADNFGNIFFSDYLNHRVRKIDVSTGILSTVVGNGNAGFSGDGGFAINATLDTPLGIALSPQGTLLIADEIAARVRQVVNLIVTTGTPTTGTTATSGTTGKISICLVT